jgi:hypothetical protein
MECRPGGVIAGSSRWRNAGGCWYIDSFGDVKRTFGVVCRVSRLVEVSRKFSRSRKMVVRGAAKNSLTAVAPSHFEPHLKG